MQNPHVASAHGRRVRVVLVDAHPVVRYGLTQALAGEPDFEVVGSTGDPGEATLMAGALRPEAVILDLAFPERGGLDLVRELRAACPEATLLVFSNHDHDLYAERALRAGASGYASKRDELPAVVHALRRVLSGPVPGAVGRPTQPDAASNGPRLTDRELQVLEHLGRGLRSREIAAAMGLSEKTIEGYRAQLRAKLGLPDAATLLQHAIRWVRLGE
ncbi:MAG: response regulator transcription factor [Planctomycetes bacterium]|nr:response regulator transcription factor [Planctomycetota bacterium]